MDGLSGLEVKVICDKKVKFFSSLGGRGKGEPEEKADKKRILCLFPCLWDLLLAIYPELQGELQMEYINR